MDEKIIDEVMDLVNLYTKEAINYYGFYNRDSTAQSNVEAWKAIRDKLREVLDKEKMTDAVVEKQVVRHPSDLSQVDFLPGIRYGNIFPDVK